MARPYDFKARSAISSHDMFLHDTWGYKREMWAPVQEALAHYRYGCDMIALFECSECGHHRAHEIEDYICIQCRYPEPVEGIMLKPPKMMPLDEDIFSS